MQTDRLQMRGGLVFDAKGYGAKGDGATDDTAAIQAALDAAASAGGGIVFLPAATYIVTQLQLRDNVEVHGAGRLATVIKLKNGATTDILVRKSTDIGLKVGLRHLTVNGNDANCPSGGGFYWNGPTNQRGPSLTIENVLITACRSTIGSGGFGALYHDGNVWSVLRDVDIVNNQNAVGAWWKTSDSYWDGVYISTNGNLTGQQNTVIQGGGGNRFVNCYWGGGSGAAQVELQGAQGTHFIGCTNDSAWAHGYQLIDSVGTACSLNVWVGGQCTNPGRAADNTYDCFSIEGAATNNLIVGLRVVGLEGTPYQPTFKGRYGINELNTASNTYVTSCMFGAFGSNVTNFRASGGSILRASQAAFDTNLSVAGNVTDANDYEKLTIDFNSLGGNVFGIYTSKAGTGSVRTLRLGANSASALEILDSNGATHWARLTGSNGGNPVLDTNGGSLQVGSTVTLAGGAAPTVSAGQVGLGSTTATSATAGANGAVPAQVAGYLIINVAGTTQKIPFYNN